MISGCVYFEWQHFYAEIFVYECLFWIEIMNLFLCSILLFNTSKMVPCKPRGTNPYYKYSRHLSFFTQITSKICSEWLPHVKLCLNFAIHWCKSPVSTWFHMQNCVKYDPAFIVRIFLGIQSKSTDPIITAIYCTFHGLVDATLCIWCTLNLNKCSRK